MAHRLCCWIYGSTAHSSLCLSLYEAISRSYSHFADVRCLLILFLFMEKSLKVCFLISAFAMMNVLHFSKREYETFFVHRFSHATMPWKNLIKNCSHYWTFGALLPCYFLYSNDSFLSTRVHAPFSHLLIGSWLVFLFIYIVKWKVEVVLIVEYTPNYVDLSISEL